MAALMGDATMPEGHSTGAAFAELVGLVRQVELLQHRQLRRRFGLSAAEVAVLQQLAACRRPCRLSTEHRAVTRRLISAGLCRRSACRGGAARYRLTARGASIERSAADEAERVMARVLGAAGLALPVAAALARDLCGA